MIVFASFTDAQLQTLDKIVCRAMRTGVARVYGTRKVTRDTLNMDISATAFHIPMDLDRLLAFEDFDFNHDIVGIQRHINRKTGVLEGHFLPRCAR